MTGAIFLVAVVVVVLFFSFLFLAFKKGANY